jgi:ABC-type uncharacterized transport system auxiliary subunit
LTFAVLTGCLGQRTTVRSYYVLKQEPNTRLPQPLFHGLLRIRNLNADEVFEKAQLVVRRSPYELHFEDASVWAVKPHQMISDILAGALESTGAFDEVSRELSESRPAYTLGGDLHAVELEDSGDAWSAHLAFTLYLDRYSTGARLWTYRYDARKPIPTESFSDGVRAISELLDTAIKASIEELKKLPRDRDEPS